MRNEKAPPVSQREFLYLPDVERLDVTSVPFFTYLTGAYQRIARKAYIRAKNFVGFPTTLEKIRSDPSWKTWVVDCGHDVMIDRPDELTSILVGLS